MGDDNSVHMKMMSFDKYGRRISVLLVILAFPIAAYTQADTLSESGKSTTSKPDTNTYIHSLYTGIGAGSNMIYLGSSISNDRPFYSGSVTYGYRNSLFASASASHLSGKDPYLAFYSLALNYSHTFNSWFDISADIAGYKTAKSLQDTLFSDFAFFNLTTGFDWKLIYTRLSFGGIFSDNNGLYLQISNSRYFETPAFFKGKASISFDPRIDVLFGELIRIETVTGMEKVGNSPPFRNFRNSQSTTTETYSTEFGLMDFEFSLPVTFNYGNFSIEAEPCYLLPAYSSSYYPLPKGFTFYINAFLKIF